MTQVTRILLVTAAAFAVATVFAQTPQRVFPIDAVGPVAAAQAPVPTTATYNLAVPAACGVFAASYRCTVQAVTAIGPNAIVYAPYYNGQPNVVQFLASDNELGALGTAKIDGVSTAGPFDAVSSGVPDRSGYYALASFTQTAAFHGIDAETGRPYTGQLSIGYTVATRCCSGGRGPHQASTWVITAGTVSIKE